MDDLNALEGLLLKCSLGSSKILIGGQLVIPGPRTEKALEIHRPRDKTWIRPPPSTADVKMWAHQRAKSTSIMQRIMVSASWKIESIGTLDWIAAKAHRRGTERQTRTFQGLVVLTEFLKSGISRHDDVFECVVFNND
jgi:hypothetical protein